LWICQGCTAAYAVGAASCPNCGATAYEEDHPMPKITVHGGATNATDDSPSEVVVFTKDDFVQHIENCEDPECLGTTSETSSSKPSSSPKTSASAARSRARTTENPS